MELCQVRDQYIRWLQAARNLSPHTIRAYSGDIAALVRFLGDHGTLSCVDPTHLLAFVEAERAAGLTPRSLRRRTAGIRGFCRWLVSADLLDEDPWTGLTVRLGSPPRLPRALPRHDLDHLLAALRDAAALGGCSIPDEALARPHPTTTLLAVVLMVAAGLRVSEVVGLRQQDIDLPGRSLRITGKGLRERYVFLTNDWVASLVTAYLTTRAALRIGHDRLLFNHHRAPLTPASMRSRLQHAALKAGLRSRITPHMLRHTAATQLIEAGVDIRYIQRLLGHASLTTTEIYTHVSDFALKRVVSDADIIGRVLISDN